MIKDSRVERFGGDGRGRLSWATMGGRNDQQGIWNSIELGLESWDHQGERGREATLYSII